MSPQSGGDRISPTPVVVRFRDNEIVEGSAVALDFDRADLELTLPEDACNNRTMIAPLSSIKLLILERTEYHSEPDAMRLRKAAVRFWDGDVLKGYLAAEPKRFAHAITVQMVSPTLEEVEVLAIPYTAVKAIFFLKAWDGRPPVYERDSGHWTLSRTDTPLLDLLGEIRGLSSLRVRGQISAVEFERRRRAVLDRI